MQLVLFDIVLSRLLFKFIITIKYHMQIKQNLK